MTGSLSRGAVAVLLLWCLAMALATLLAARPADPTARLDAEFGAMAPSLPPRGVIGYLGPEGGPGNEAPVRTQYAAQYALAPRVLVPRPGPDYLIVEDGTAPGDDPRLAGYALVLRTPSGHRLLRRASR